jgi:hypothetical protein
VIIYSCLYKATRNNLWGANYDNSTFFILFTCLQVDMAALRQMGESDLKDMGVPMVGWKFTDFCSHHGSILASLWKI